MSVTTGVLERKFLRNKSLYHQETQIQNHTGCLKKRGYLRPTLKAFESHSLLDNIAIRARTLSEILPSERALFQKYYHPSARAFRNITIRA